MKTLFKWSWIVLLPIILSTIAMGQGIGRGMVGARSFLTAPVFRTSITAQGLSGANACIKIIADAGEDDDDKWRYCVADSGNATLESKATGSWVVVWTFTNAGAVAFTNALSMGANLITDLADAVNPTDAANLQTVLEHTGVSFNYYLGDTTLDLTLTESEGVIQETQNADPDELSLIFFVALEADTITPFMVPAGTVIVVHFDANVTTTASKYDTVLYVKLGYVDSGGSSNFVQIGSNSDNTDTLTAAQTSYEQHIHVATEITVPVTKRVYLQVWADSSGTGGFAEINFYFDSVGHHVQFAVGANILEDFLVKSKDLSDVASASTSATNLGLGTGDTPQFTGIELGHATDTTITRPSGGDIAVEGNIIYRAGGTDVPVADGGTGAGTFTDGGPLIGSGTNPITAMAVGSLGQVPVSQGTGDPAWEYRQLNNLLENTEWIAASLSGLDQGRTVGQQSNSYDVGAAILDNDGTSIGSWNGTTTRCTVTVSGGEFIMTDDGTGSTMETSVDLSGLTIGALYKFAAQIDNGAGAGTWAVGAGAGLQVEPNGGGTNIRYVASQTEAGAMEDYSVIWVATETNNRITFVADVGAGEAVNFDNVYVIQVTPGFVDANKNCFDGGWGKNADDIDVLREPNGSNTADGSFNAMKVVGGAGSGEVNMFKYAGGLAGVSTLSWHIAKYEGQTLTIGCLVKSSTGSKARIFLHDSITGYEYSAFHSGGGAYEWLEISLAVGSATTLFEVGVDSGSSTTAYFSQPMLVYGSSIGERNYQAPRGDWINIDASISPTGLAGNTLVSADNQTFNLEATTSGKLGKGIKTFTGTLRGVSSSASKYLYLYPSVGVYNQGFDLLSQVASVQIACSGVQPLDTNGNFRMDTNVAWTGVRLRILTVQTR